MSYDKNKVYIDDLPTVVTPYGTLRFFPQGTHPDDFLPSYLSFAEESYMKVHVVAAAKDGGLTLPDGRTYATPPGKDIAWDMLGGIKYSPGFEDQFAIRADVKGEYCHTWSWEATFISQLILDLAVTQSFDFAVPYPELITRAHSSYEVFRASLREAKDIEAKIQYFSSEENWNFAQKFKEIRGVEIGSSVVPKMKVSGGQ